MREPVIRGDLLRILQDESSDGVADIRILIDPPVEMLEVVLHSFPDLDDHRLISAYLFTTLPIEDICLRDAIMSCLDECLLDGILDMLDRGDRLFTRLLHTFDDSIGQSRYLREIIPTDRFDRFLDRLLDLCTIECDDRTIAFAYFIESHSKERGK